MNTFRSAFWVVGLATVLAMMLAGCGDGESEPAGSRKKDTRASGDRGTSPEAGAVDQRVAVGDRPMRVTGPYRHANLAIYLFHTDQRDDQQFITLDEGLASKQVTVSEKQNAEVQKLVIENASAYPLFLQEGDRLVGGKQDRIVYASAVIPAGSGKVPIPSFCVEQSRWQAGEQGTKFTGADNVALAPKSVRVAAKAMKDQGAVWEHVSESKMAFVSDLEAGMQTTSSLTEAMDDPKVKAISDEAVDALQATIDANPDAVGIGFAVNGRIEEIDIYPGHTLLSKVAPRLIRSYAVDAALAAETQAGEAPEAGQIIAFMNKLRRAKSRKSETINAGNVMDIAVYHDHVAEFDNAYGGRSVHYQLIQADEKTLDMQDEQRWPQNLEPGDPVNQQVPETRPNAPVPNEHGPEVDSDLIDPEK
jgi:hypothetical protein